MRASYCRSVMSAAIAEIFRRAGCTGQLCVQALDGGQEVALDADRRVVSASVFKVNVALEAETQFADGRLDPRERVTLPAGRRTPGPVGFSLFRDDVTVSLQDLVVPMLTISDNVATDTLVNRIGVDVINASAVRLGLTRTTIRGDLATMINSLGRAAGFADWAALSAWAAGPHSAADEAQVDEKLAYADALSAKHGTCTTPRDMARLLRLIWTDQAGPPAACARVRELTGQQLTRHRIASAFTPPVRVSAKSGGLMGTVRNEVGVVEYPDGRAYVVAVFTQAAGDRPSDAAVNAAIGTAAAAAIDALTG